jgi:hypothetical protein
MRLQVLALDEFFVTDVADAMLLSRLFGRLWENGLVLVATSNRAPDALYEGGLQRNLFLPFIAKLKVSSGAELVLGGAAGQGASERCRAGAERRCGARGLVASASAEGSASG